jgi:uncharacterized protein FAM83
MSKLGVLNLVKAAHDMVHARTDSMEGLERFLVTWFCTKFETTPNDPRLEEMTLEELVTVFYMHRLSEDPKVVQQLVHDGEDEYEKWLKQEMEDEYLSDEEMVQGMVQYEENQKDKRRAKDGEMKAKLKDLPERITTEFPSFEPQDKK